MVREIVRTGEMAEGTCPRGDMSRGKCPIHSNGLSRTSYSLSYMYIANHDVMVASVIDPREKKPF